jgi:ATP-dependent Clp protease protease subunit
MKKYLNIALLVLLSTPILYANIYTLNDVNNSHHLEKKDLIRSLTHKHKQLLENLEKLKLKNKILKTKFKLKELSKINNNYNNNIHYESQLKKLENDAKLTKIKAEKKTNEMNIKKTEWELKTEKLEAEITILKIKRERANYIDKEALYLDEPLKKDNTLVISDRRISLNGPISSTMASEITHKINYFNNKNHTKPIFLVIDSSPGGSVMAGYLIVKAMESSKAPVYVVLKSFAASMAAIIVSTAEKSFAYSHATMLHHQPSIFQNGNNNLTEQKESYKHLEKWWKYLAKPVAKKMGISIEEFQKQMYVHSSKGDWSEFAMDAHKLKWVNHIVSHIEETGILDDTLEHEKSEKEKENKNATAINYLPRLSPTDAYLIYNPDGYYKTR